MLKGYLCFYFEALENVQSTYFKRRRKERTLGNIVLVYRQQRK